MIGENEATSIAGLGVISMHKCAQFCIKYTLKAFCPCSIFAIYWHKTVSSVWWQIQSKEIQHFVKLELNNAFDFSLFSINCAVDWAFSVPISTARRSMDTATRERIWNILKNPNNFVGSKDKAPVPDKACNRECWHGRAFFKMLFVYF